MKHETDFSATRDDAHSKTKLKKNFPLRTNERQGDGLTQKSHHDCTHVERPVTNKKKSFDCDMVNT